MPNCLRNFRDTSPRSDQLVVRPDSMKIAAIILAALSACVTIDSNAAISLGDALQSLTGDVGIFQDGGISESDTFDFQGVGFDLLDQHGLITASTPNAQATTESMVSMAFTIDPNGISASLYGEIAMSSNIGAAPPTFGGGSVGFTQSFDFTIDAVTPYQISAAFSLDGPADYSIILFRYSQGGSATEVFRFGSSAADTPFSGPLFGNFLPGSYGYLSELTANTYGEAPGLFANGSFASEFVLGTVPEPATGTLRINRVLHPFFPQTKAPE